jgi:hypothetical protein
MRMSATDQQALGVIDIVVPEPGEGAHAEPVETARRLKPIILDRLDALAAMTIDEVVEARYRRYRALGAYTEVAQPEVPQPVNRGLADRVRDLLDAGRRTGTPGLTGRSRDEPPAHEEV